MQPNVLFLLLDSVRYDATSIGRENLTNSTTPFLSDYAQKSTGFTNAVSPAIWTLPSHASITTGLYPEEHQVNDSGTVLGDHRTIGQVAKELEYTTGVFTRNSWLFTGEILRGISDIEYLQDRRAQTKYELLKWVADRPGKVGNLSTNIINSGPWRASSDRQLLARTKEAIENTDGPYMFFVNLMDAHWPYIPSSPFHNSEISKYNTIMGLKNIIVNQRKIFSNIEEVWAGKRNVEWGVVDVMKNLYLCCVKQIDSLLKEFINSLEDELEDTIVIIVGDHGELFREDHLVGHHFSVDDALTHVPLIINDPTDQLTQERRKDLVQTLDLYPTICELIGGSGDANSGISLISQSDRGHAFSHYKVPQEGHIINKIKNNENISLKDVPPLKQYKAISESGQSVKVGCNIETNGNSRSLNTLNKHMENISKVEPKNKDSSPDDEVIKNLSDLGYLK
jgi:arylsulfatase A-like enzyme